MLDTAGASPPYGKYIEGPFSQGRKMAEDMVGSIMMEGFIAQMNTPFKVNLQQIKETYEYVPMCSSLQGVKEKIQQGATAVIFPPPSMHVPPLARMSMPPPRIPGLGSRQKEAPALAPGFFLSSSGSSVFFKWLRLHWFFFKRPRLPKFLLLLPCLM